MSATTPGLPPDDNGPAGQPVVIRVDPRARDEVVAACRAIADERFAELVRHPDAPGMFKGGKDAQPDARGFRPTYPDRLRAWLASQLGVVTDRLGMPIPPPSHGGRIDVQ